MNPTRQSTTEVYGKTQSLMCLKDRNGMVTVETPSRQVKDYYKILGLRSLHFLK